MEEFSKEREADTIKEIEELSLDAKTKIVDILLKDFFRYIITLNDNLLELYTDKKEVIIRENSCGLIDSSIANQEINVVNSKIDLLNSISKILIDKKLDYTLVENFTDRF